MSDHKIEITFTPPDGKVDPREEDRQLEALDMVAFDLKIEVGDAIRGHECLDGWTWEVVDG